MRFPVIAGVVLAGCSVDDDIQRRMPIEVETPLSAEALQDAFDPAWKVGTTWMVKELCHPGPRRRSQVPDLLGPWPAYSYFEVLAATQDAFVLLRMSHQPLAAAAGTVEATSERFLFRRHPFGLADKMPRESSSPDLAAFEPWSAGPCVVLDASDPSCPLMPAVPGDDNEVDRWSTHQGAFATRSGIRFSYWEPGATFGSFEWHSGEPYWEDSYGCSRLVRNLDGSVHRPSHPADIGDAEPTVSPSPPRDRRGGSPATLMPGAWSSVVKPLWRVGDTWVTQHRCPDSLRGYVNNGSWVFGWPHRTTSRISTFSFYEVLYDHGDEWVILEGKVSWKGARHRRPGEEVAPSSYHGATLFHTFLKHPFGLVRWEVDGLRASYRGGPCLNVGPAIDRCPFAMPADPPADGSTPPAWVGEQRLQRDPKALVFEYGVRDGTELTIRWANGEPWPEATPSCTKLLRNPDGSALRPGDVGDAIDSGIGSFLDQWEKSDEFRAELETMVEPPPRRPWQVPSSSWD